IRVSVWVSRDTVERGRPQRLEISRLPSRASCPSKHRSTSKARDTTWITSPSPARSLASIPCLLSRSERLPIVMAPWPNFAVRNKIPLAEQTTSGNLRPQQKAVREDTSPSDGPRENGNARYQDRHRSRRPRVRAPRHNRRQCRRRRRDRYRRSHEDGNSGDVDDGGKNQGYPGQTRRRHRRRTGRCDHRSLTGSRHKLSSNELRDNLSNSDVDVRLPNVAIASSR